MRKKFYLLLFICLFGFLSVAYAENEVIKSFNVEMKINSNGSLDVIETIVYDFGNNQKHGIIRNIPLTSQNGPLLNITVLGVTDLNGINYPYTTSISNNILQIKIGDPNILVSGTKIYKINYLVQNAIRNFSEHQELYWNVTGNDWPVAIEKSQVMIFLDKPIPSPQMACYTGSFKSQEKNCDFIFHETSVEYFLTKPLGPKEGFTIVLGLPPNYISIGTNSTISNIKSDRNVRNFSLDRFALLIAFIFTGFFFLLLLVVQLFLALLKKF